MNETLSTLLIGVGVGIGLALLYLAYRIKMVMNTLDRYIEDAIEQVTDTFVPVVVEKNNNTYYCYRKEDHQFVCQGKDLKSLVEAFKTTCPDKTAVIADTTAPEIVAEIKEAFKV